MTENNLFDAQNTEQASVQNLVQETVQDEARHGKTSRGDVLQELTITGLEGKLNKYAHKHKYFSCFLLQFLLHSGSNYFLCTSYIFKEK